MSDATTKGHSLGYSVNMDELTSDRIYYLDKEGYKVTNNPFYRGVEIKVPKATFNDKWSAPIVTGFNTDLEYEPLNILLSENTLSLTHFFDEQRILRQQYELLKLLEN